MDDFVLQRYFKTVCNNYVAAYNAEKRQRALNTNDGSFWSSTLREKMWEICGLIEVLAESKVKIIITSKTEIIPLIEFFGFNKIEKYQIINTDENVLEFFPQDEMSKQFLEAYKEGSGQKIHELYMKYFEV